MASRLPVTKQEVKKRRNYTQKDTIYRKYL